MDVFATYDKAALEDPNQFWIEVDDILRTEEWQDRTQGEGSSSGQAHATPVVDAILLQTRLISFLALCDSCYDQHLDQSTNWDEILNRLLESPLILQASTHDIANVLITLVTSAKSLPTLHLLFDSLLHIGSRHPEIYRSRLAATQLIPRLVHHFWAARYAEEYLVREVGNKEGNGEEGGYSLDWNIKHVRAISMGDAKKQQEQARDRKLQCRLRDESVILLYEVCRAQRLEVSEMRSIDATFINHLFDLVEGSRHWHDDSYNYQLIKLIVALNEQFMVSGIGSADPKGSNPKKGNTNHSNIVMTVLRTRLNASNTFGENLIWMLNRASSLNAEDVCMQLLVLKLLYLLFTTRETAHYFYTNDLKVLVDVFIRELSDLPEDSDSLRHTYLRVLHPLLTNTQLLTYPYKRNQIRRLLLGLTSHAHLRDISSTTKRLVDRCLNAQWCVDLDAIADPGKIPETDTQPQKQTLTIQSIAGGPRTFVEAETVTDGEGVTIPMKRHEPYQGAPSSTSSTFAVAAAFLPDRMTSQDLAHSTSAAVTATPQEEDAIPSRFRDKRVNSVSSATMPSIQQEQLDSREIEEASGRSREKIAMTRRDASGSSTLTVRRDLGQRASSARSAAVPPSEPTCSTSTLRQERRRGEVDADDDESKWSEGSISNSWQLGMAGDHQHQRPSRPSLSNAPSQDPTRYGSPLSQDSTEHYFTLSASPIEDNNHKSDSRRMMQAPVLQVEQVLEDEGILPIRGGSNSSISTNGSSGGGLGRRRPPAPPMSDGGLASRKERRAMLSSTSENNLSSSSSSSFASSAMMSKKDSIPKSLALDMISLPNSPRSESVESSREPSPTLDHLPSSRRRRPPPPPVNRATKGSRTPNQPMSLTRTNSSTSQQVEEQKQTQQEQHHHQPSEEAFNTTDEGIEGEKEGHHPLEKAMDYLYVSESGYGW